MSGKKAKSESFEQSLAKLENIVNDLENQDIALEDLMQYYKEGNELAKHCFNLIKQAESEIIAIKSEEDAWVKI